MAPADTLRIDLDVRGAPEGAELTFTLHSPVTAPVGVGTAQARFDAWVDGTANLGADPFNSPKTFAVAALPPADGTGRINAAFQIVPEDQPEPLVGFQIEDPGVYPLTIALSGPEGGAPLDLMTTYLVRLPAAAQAGPPLTVAAMVDLRAPVALEPDGTRSLAPSALDRIRTLIETLDETGTVPVSVGATPETLEALAATGPIPTSGATPTAPTTGPELLDGLEAALADRLVLGSTYVEVDVPAWTRSSMGAALAYQLSHGANVTEAVVPASAPVDQRTWVADRALTPEALAELGRNGIDQVVLPEAIVGPVDTRTAPDPEQVQVAVRRRRRGRHRGSGRHRRRVLRPAPPHHRRRGAQRPDPRRRPRRHLPGRAAAPDQRHPRHPARGGLRGPRRRARPPVAVTVPDRSGHRPPTRRRRRVDRHGGHAGRPLLDPPGDGRPDRGHRDRWVR